MAGLYRSLLHVVFAVCLLMQPSNGAKFYYPTAINPALGKPVTLSPDDSTCGQFQREQICESRTNTVSDCETRKLYCEWSCPFGNLLPAYVSVFSNNVIEDWSTNCVMKDTNEQNYPLQARTTPQFVVNFKGTPQGGGTDACYLTLPPDHILPMALSTEWSMSISTWINPTQQAIGTIVDFANAQSSSLLRISLRDNRIWISSKDDIHPTSWTVDPDTWQHISIQIHGSTASFFRNGQFLWPAMYVNDTFESTRTIQRSRIGNSFTGVEPFKGYMHDFRIYYASLTNREVKEVYEGDLTPVSPQSECRCPSYAPKIRGDDSTYCVVNEGKGKPATNVFRLNTDAHLPHFVTDGKMDTKWISKQRLDMATISIDLLDEYEIRLVKLHFYSPFPSAVILRRRYGSNSSWQNWQLFSYDCRVQTGYFTDEPLNNEQAINCKPYVKEGEVMPFSQGVLTFDLLEGRPGQEGDGSLSLALREFLLAGALQVEMRGHPYIENQLQEYHSLIEVELQGYCNCHGHGVECILSDVSAQYHCVCADDSYTTGRQCDECKNSTYQELPAASSNAYDPVLCKPCNCSPVGTSGDNTNTCERVGGQCPCKQHVGGRACDQCDDGYFKLHPDNVRGCSICTCHSPGTVGSTNTCDKTTGACPCKPNVRGDSCRDCAPRYFMLSAANDDGCEACDCFTAGTQGRSRECDGTTGQCTCKTNVAGRQCNECRDGFYNLRDSSAVGCQACGCDSQGSYNSTCHPTTGQCFCRANVVGRRCDQCAPGKYALSTDDLTANGCTHACDCNTTGSIGSSCARIGGQCSCKANAKGRQCDACTDLAYGFGQSLPNGCLSCGCDADGTMAAVNAPAIPFSCHEQTGACACKPNVKGRTCNACEAGTYGLRLSPTMGCRACSCYGPGTVDGTVCDPVTGQCDCKPNDGEKGLAGLQCSAYLISMVPEWGPEAGGTNVLIKGGFLGNVTSASVTVGGRLECAINKEKSDPTMIECSTSKLDVAQAALEQNLEVEVQLADQKLLYLRNASFTYKPDPVIYTVEPRRTILSGGLPITVSGEHLDSVHSPYILLYVTWRDVNGTAQMDVASNLCVEIRSLKMICMTPAITIVEGPGTKDVRYTIGFRLDGVTDYLNLNESLPEQSTIMVYADPEIETFEEEVLAYRTYWPYGHTHLDIKGQRLNHGPVSADYSVSVGDSLCEEVEVTEKNIVCFPPDKQPLSLLERDYPEVVVRVGNKQVIVGYLRYEHSFWDNDPFRYGVFGGIGAAILLIVLITICCCCCRCRRDGGDDGRGKVKRGSKSGRAAAGLEAGMMTTSSNDYVDKGFTNTGMSSFSASHPVNTLSLLELMPTKLKTAISDRLVERKHITLGTIIGQGQYGQVYLGRLADRTSTQQLPVAIKTMKEDCSTKQEAIDFLQEATLMKEFQHDNIMPLVGVVVEKDKVFVLLPFMENGDMRSFISNDGNMLTVGELINFGQQVCAGMCYLSERHFIHRDLAARNCMVNKDLVVKIGDFGLSRDIYEDDYYEVSDTRRKLPIKWMAPESLERGVFSTKTDVWSFGVLQWELLTRGCNPYPDVDAFDVKHYLRQGNRMDRPDFAPEEMYQLMLMCWDVEPRSRPSFYEIQQQIAAFLEMQNARTNLRKRQRQQVPTQRGNSYLIADEAL